MIVIIGRSSGDRVDRHLILTPQSDGKTHVEVTNPERSAGYKMFVNTDNLRGLGQKQSGSIFGIVDGNSSTGSPARMEVKPTEQPDIVGIYACPIEWGESGEAIEKNGGWAIRIRMVDWQRFLANLV